MRNITYIILHCTATPQNTTIQSILNYWKNFKKWRNPGYHKLIKADGECVNLLDILKISNGAKGYNHNSIHVAYIGGIDECKKPLDNRTVKQILTMQRVLKELCLRFPNAKILGHNELPNVTKACPSFSVQKWLSEKNFMML